MTAAANSRSSPGRTRASGRSFLLIGVTGITRRFNSMAGAIFVRVSAGPAGTQARTFEIWGVATNEPAEAGKGDKARVPPGRNVEAIHDRPSEETITRLALPPGKAWLL